MFLWLTVYIFRSYVCVNFIFWLQYFVKLTPVRSLIVYLIDYG